ARLRRAWPRGRRTPPSGRCRRRRASCPEASPTLWTRSRTVVPTPVSETGLETSRGRARLFRPRPPRSAELFAHQRDDLADLVGEGRELRGRDLLRGVGERLLGPRMRLDDQPVGADG